MSIVCKCRSSEWKQLPCHKYSMSPLREQKRHSRRKNFVHRLWSPYVQHYTVKEEAYQNVFKLMRSDRYLNGVQKGFSMNGDSLGNRSCTNTVIFGDLTKQDDDSLEERKRHVSCPSREVPLLLEVLRKGWACEKSPIAMRDNDFNPELMFAFQIQTVTAQLIGCAPLLFK